MIKTDSTMKAWKTALRYVMHEGKDFMDRDGRMCREIMNLQIEIIKPEGDITSPIEHVSGNKDWVYPRLDDIANVTLTRKFSPGHIYVYGQRIFNFDGNINQIDKFVIPLLRKDEPTRRATVSLWDPKIDADIFNKEVPSMTSISFFIRENKMDVTVIIRSNNLFFGFPANIYQTYILQEYVAQRLNKELGKITLLLLSAHIFEDQFGDVEEMIR